MKTIISIDKYEFEAKNKELIEENQNLKDMNYSLFDAYSHISNESYNIQKGQRLFQITGRYLEFIECNLTERLSETDRGNQGFGSTGQ